MTDETTVVTITLGDIYATQLQQGVILTEIQSTLALAALQVSYASEVVKDHEGRLRKVEAKVYALPSVATVVAVAALAWSIYGK